MSFGMMSAAKIQRKLLGVQWKIRLHFRWPTKSTVYLQIVRKESKINGHLQPMAFQVNFDGAIFSGCGVVIRDGMGKFIAGMLKKIIAMAGGRIICRVDGNQGGSPVNLLLLAFFILTLFWKVIHLKLLRLSAAAGQDLRLHMR